MPRDIRVGDRVRLLGWDGIIEDCGFHPRMQQYVGTVIEVSALRRGPNGTTVEHAGWSWPVSTLELLDAPRPSAWTKTSEGKPDVGVWVLGWMPVLDEEAAEQVSPQFVCRLLIDGQWQAEDLGNPGERFIIVNAPDYWQPLPAPPEVSK